MLARLDCRDCLHYQAIALIDRAVVCVNVSCGVVVD